jgi:hypothetical protein
MELGDVRAERARPVFTTSLRLLKFELQDAKSTTEIRSPRSKS